MTITLLYTGISLYVINYTIGWLLHFRFISLTRLTHQIFFAAIILNLILFLILVKLSAPGFVFCLSSLICMLILPLGKKGGMYHRAVSTAGLVLFLLLLIVEN
ncbi:MAG: hypothetical protein ABI462_00395 [Ignavibacteria bacterium]